MKPYLILSLLSISLWSYAQPNLTTGPPNGSLIIMGSGYDSTVIQKFKELAGGRDAKWIIIPTALDDLMLKSFLPSHLKENELFAQMPNYEVLHTRDRAVANADTFVQRLRTATGVLLMGGRQWRLADSYLNTKVQAELRNLLARGGVIMGGSAGATIQGSYLIRGDTKSNTTIMGDHEEGFGFISNIAIDQHLLARNRAFDMFELLDKRPELLGIGLDEGAAILVQKNKFEVLTDKYVAIYDGTRMSVERDTLYQLPKGSRDFYFLRKGDKYDLEQRKPMNKLGVNTLPDQYLRALTATDCHQESSLKSISSLTYTLIRFRNNTAEPVNIYWINYQGEAQKMDAPFQTVAPNKTMLVQTYLTHPFVVRDTKGNCISIYQPLPEPGIAVINPK